MFIPNNLGWKADINLQQGIESTYEWFLENEGIFKKVKIKGLPIKVTPIETKDKPVPAERPFTQC